MFLRQKRKLQVVIGLILLMQVLFYRGVKKNVSDNKQSDIGMERRNTHKGSVDNITHTCKSPFIDVKIYKSPPNNQTNIKHTILWWNQPYWIKRDHFPDFYKKMNQCSYKNCEVTRDRKQLRNSSAVIFSLVEGNAGRSPPLKPQDRNPDQAWIFFSLESPVHTHSFDQRSSTWQNVFNWSWTYRQDADIFLPYGYLSTRTNVPVKNYTEIFRKKTKSAAWLVSICSRPSRRQEYVRKLKHYIPVDIYGRCGMHAPPDISRRISSEYKFYLAFENSLCKDYVTEKFYRSYARDVVTVVRGGTDYNNVFPNGSFVNAADFSSIKELGEFLQKLASNKEEFIKYLKEKDKYEMHEDYYVYTNAICNICEKVNNMDKYRKTIKNAVSWLGTCKAPTDLH